MMGYLPHHRRIITGRTYTQSWDPASMDPIRVYHRPLSHWWITVPTTAAIILLALAFVYA